MIALIDDHRDAYGVEPICRVLPIAPSTYHERVAQRQDPARLSARARQDAALKPESARVFAENFAVYGVRKVWRQMMRDGVSVARCTVARLMREMGLAGVIRGKPVRTTISNKTAPCPGTVGIFVCGWAVRHYAAMALMNRSPKMMANWALAMDHSRGPMLHSFSERFKTRKRSFIAASSLGKWPRARTARRSLAFSA